MDIPSRYETEQINLRLDRLTSEISQLRHEVQQLVGYSLKSNTKSRYISTKDFGLLIGKSSKTICQWLNDGRFPDTVYKRKRRGSGFIYMIDCEPALLIAEKIMIM